MPQAVCTIANDADDDTVESVATTYSAANPGTAVWGAVNGVNQVGRTFLSPNYYIRVGLLKFTPPGGIPSNALVTGAALRLTVTTTLWDDSSLDYRLSADFYQWTPSTSDYAFVPGTNAISGSTAWRGQVDLSPFDVPLTGLSGVSLFNPTYLRLHFTNPGAPTANNIINLHQHENPTSVAAGYVPQLLVDYVLTQRMAPTAIEELTNLTGTVGDIDEPVGSGGTDWLVAP